MTLDGHQKSLDELAEVIANLGISPKSKRFLTEKIISTVVRVRTSFASSDQIGDRIMVAFQQELPDMVKTRVEGQNQKD